MSGEPIITKWDGEVPRTAVHNDRDRDYFLNLPKSSETSRLKKPFVRRSEQAETESSRDLPSILKKSSLRCSVDTQKPTNAFATVPVTADGSRKKNLGQSYDFGRVQTSDRL
jgi:hypothetical protein